MAEKPKIVIIGEVHPYAIENKLIAEGKLRVKIKTVNGRKRLVADIFADKGETKAGIQKINNRIIKEEVRILKKERITRLFTEEEDTKKKKLIYSRFRQKKDLKLLKSELRRENERAKIQVRETAKRFLAEIGTWPPVLKGFEHQFQVAAAERGSGLFSLTLINVAHKAGIYDIIPVEEERCFEQAGAIAEVILSIKDVASWLTAAYSKADISEREKETILNSIKRSINDISRIAGERLLSIDDAREKNVCRNITENYVLGSALICGMDHVDHLEELLSKKFDVKTYRVGEGFM